MPPFANQTSECYYMHNLVQLQQDSKCLLFSSDSRCCYQCIKRQKNEKSQRNPPLSSIQGVSKSSEESDPMNEKAFFHVRSVSLPSQTHPTTLRVEEQLHKIKESLELSPSKTSSIKMDVICSGLRQLAELYNSIEYLLQLPSIQQGILRSDQIKWMEKDVDGSMKLLDVCGALKDAVITSRKQLQDLQFALRRRGDSSIGEKVRPYIRSRKETNKIIKKSCKDLFRTDCKSQSTSQTSEDSVVSVVFKVLNESRIITKSLLCSILCCMFMSKTKASMWHFASKTKIGSVEDQISELCASHRAADAEELLMVQNRLKTFETSFGEVENDLECLFRRLIQNRVSLLNILSL